MSGTVPASIETIVNDLQDVSWEQVASFTSVLNRNTYDNLHTKMT